jgi:hypothetical protein
VEQYRRDPTEGAESPERKQSSATMETPQEGLQPSAADASGRQREEDLLSVLDEQIAAGGRSI